jgi:hypothetical protein
MTWKKLAWFSVLAFVVCAAPMMTIHVHTNPAAVTVADGGAPLYAPELLTALDGPVPSPKVGMASALDGPVPSPKIGMA